MMGRRLAGVALLILAVVAAVVVGGRNAKYLPGTAQTAAMADPPHVGDCVVVPPEAQEYPPVLVIGPCTSDRYGGVVAVFPDTLDQFINPALPVDPDDPSSVESACERTGIAFLGLTMP